MSVIKDRRLGFFRMALPLINQMPAAARAVMSEVIVLRAELKIENDEIEYLAICEAFAPVAPGEIIRRYAASIRSGENGTATFDSWDAL
jgi:hypothetical protein